MRSSIKVSSSHFQFKQAPLAESEVAVIERRLFPSASPAVPVMQSSPSIANLLRQKREHALRLANQNGAAGELLLLGTEARFFSRPRGAAMKLLMTALKESGISIKPTSFDFLVLPEGLTVDHLDINSIRAALPEMKFIEVKTANQTRVQPDFAGFYFALTEAEIMASEALRERHVVILFNKTTGSQLVTSVPEILARARSSTWQLSVQL